MRALALVEPGGLDIDHLRLGEQPIPQPAADELLLQVAACAICRTDLQIAQGDLAPRKLPVVPGHQAVGRVEAIGRSVSGWTVGERAGVGWLAETCGTCAACRSGRENLCPDARFTGWDRDGGYAEWMTVKADFALRLPDGPSDLAAAPMLCGGVIGYRALKIANVQPGSRLGLYGFGASALVTIQVARHWGCDVYVATRNPAERDRAIRLGAAWAGGYDDLPPVALDAAVTFAPAGAVVVAALRALDRGGTVAINAIHLDRVPDFPYELLWGERGLRSVANYTREDAREFLDLAARIPIQTQVDPFLLADGVAGLRAVADGTVAGAAVLLTDSHVRPAGSRSST
jgi:propanol-preferring alcohol dehydrogenase